MQTSSFISKLSEKDLKSPSVIYLLEVIERQSLEIEGLKEEVRMLKGHSAKPSIRPNSNLEGSKSQSLKGVKKNSPC